MEKIAEILNKSKGDFLPISVDKPLDLVYDAGRLMAFDSNDLDDRTLRCDPNDYLRDLTRDNVQLLMNQIWELPTERVEDVIIVKLPPPKFTLPRAKHVPKPKPLTKWQQFALEKGLQKTKKSKVTWDEELKKWIPTYGYKRAAAEREKDWVLEVPQNSDPYEDQFAKKAFKKSERVAKNELQRLRNIARAKNIKIPRTGMLNPDVQSAKELQTAVTVARSSTASAGKFQSKLPKEKEATNVHSLIPGGNRKRKLPPISGDAEKRENLSLVDSVLNKRPKIDIERAVARQLSSHGSSSMTEERHTDRPKGRGGKGAKAANPKSGKKPKGGKGVHKKGSGNHGRKRR